MFLSSFFISQKTHEIFKKVLILFWFSVPILISQISVMSIDTMDNMMVGQQGAQITKIVGAANSIYITIYITLMAFIFALIPLISRDIGAKKNLAPWWIQGVWLVAVISGLGFMILSDVSWIFKIKQFNLPQELYQPVQEFLNIMKYTLILGLAFKLFYVFNTALNRINLLIILHLVGLILNYFLNLYFLPRYGANGLGITYLLLNGFFVTTALLFLCFDHFYRNNKNNNQQRNEYLWDWAFLSHYQAWFPKLEYVKKIMFFGIPIFASMAIEVGCFTIMSLLMVQYSEVLMNSHQNINSIVTTLYIIPLALGTAINIKISQAIGAKNYKDAIEFSIAGITLGLLWLAVSMPMLAILSDFIFQLYLPEIVKTSSSLLVENTQLIKGYMVQLLPYLLLVQMFDVIQTVLARILQAFGIVNTQFIIYFIGLWGFGLGLGYYLNQVNGVSVNHYWYSMTWGLTFVSIVFAVMTWWHLRKKSKVIV
jgi:MATE family multidrug resistance protein